MKISVVGEFLCKELRGNGLWAKKRSMVTSIFLSVLDKGMLYTVKNMVVENKELVYNDGVVKLFLYTKGKRGGSEDLKSLLTYFETDHW